MAKRRPRARTALAPAMTVPIGTRLIEVAIELLEKVYVNLPMKRSMYAVNPVQRLRLLQRRLSGARALSEREFYNEMLSVFLQMRDLHTQFVMPEPFRSATASLGFRLERCVEADTFKYLVSRLDPDAPRYPGFVRGAEVTHWNGVPIARAVAANAERESGGNTAARHARGLEALTIRWLGVSLLPDEDWVDIRYLSPRGTRQTPRTARFQWTVFQEPTVGEKDVAARARSLHVGLDIRGEVQRKVRQYLLGASRPARQPRETATGVRSYMPEHFPSCRDVRTPRGTVAYVRIASFNVEDDGPFVNEFIRIIGELSQHGLIIDVRGNPGGLIHAGERLLQLLTPRRIEPCRFHFLNSAHTERLTRRRTFRPWNDSIGQAVETGAEYSQGLPLQRLERYNDIGQKYQGPVVLVTDALCYSATDVFAAGFQDNGIGRVLGVDEFTGAGGANVWEYALISRMLGLRGRFPPHLPNGASFTFAVRRATRVGPASGAPLEDIGVRADEVHQFTRADVLNGNVDLIRHAGRMLARMPRQRLTAVQSGPSAFQVDCENVERVDAYLSGRPLTSTPVRGRAFEMALPSRHGGRELRLEGFRADQLVAATRVRCT